MTIFDCHAHIMLFEDIPDRFLPLKLVRRLAKRNIWRIIARLLNHINPFSDNDALDRYATFMRTGMMKSQKAIFEKLLSHYPPDTKFVILPMDTRYMGAGNVPREYSEQLSELDRLYHEYPDNIIPFIMADPRNPEIVKQVEYYVGTRGWGGVKIYTHLGYFPYDERLDPVYDICVANNKPIMAHGSPGNPVHFRGNKSELRALLSKSKDPVETRGKRKDLIAQFTNPLNYHHVIEKHPKLRICCAHFGSGDMWKEHMEHPENDETNWYVIVKKMIRQYPDNFYTDISYTMFEEDFWPILKLVCFDPVLSKNILFGTDYYMVQVETNVKVFSIKLRGYLGESIFQKLSNTNPKRYLGL